MLFILASNADTDARVRLNRSARPAPTSWNLRFVSLHLHFVLRKLQAGGIREGDFRSLHILHRLVEVGAKLNLY